MVPSPSCPSRFRHQQNAVPLVVTPQVWRYPAPTAVKSLPPMTATGLIRPTTVPSPSWPDWLSPQQYTSRPVVTPQVWLTPALTTAKASPPRTRTGLARLRSAPSPSCPDSLSPPQYASPPVVNPQLWRNPASTAANRSPPLTSTGLVRLVRKPSPSCPAPLLPQQYAAPSVVTPQECAIPASTLAKVRWTANAALVTLVSPAAVATRVYPLPGRSTTRSSNVAIPFTACTVVVPNRVAPLGFSPRASVTAFVAPGTVLPAASWTASWIGGDITTPPATLGGGGVTKASAPRPITANGLLRARARPAAAASSVYPLPGRSTRRSLNVATPSTARTVVVPKRVAPVGLS